MEVLGAPPPFPPSRRVPDAELEEKTSDQEDAGSSGCRHFAQQHLRCYASCFPHCLQAEVLILLNYDGRANGSAGGVQFQRSCRPGSCTCAWHAGPSTGAWSARQLPVPAAAGSVCLCVASIHFDCGAGPIPFTGALEMGTGPVAVSQVFGLVRHFLKERRCIAGTAFATPCGSYSSARHGNIPLIHHLCSRTWATP